MGEGSRVVATAAYVVQAFLGARMSRQGRLSWRPLHPPVPYSQYSTTIAVPAATNANRVITNQSRRESFSSSEPSKAAAFVNFSNVSNIDQQLRN
jgi:hypothetical protein